jgi:Na+-driven multidrug efflux pump
LKGVFEYALPLFAITIVRLSGFVAMQKTAMALGATSLAAYQLCFSMMVFFLYFGEPLSQLSQTQLPALIEAKDGEAVLETLKSALTLAAYTSIAIGGIAYCMVAFGSSIFCADAGVQLLAKQTAPSVFAAVSTAVFAVALDGSMQASRDFGFMLSCGLFTFFLQLFLLRNYCTTVAFIFGTWTMRLGSYAALTLLRVSSGYGPLGRVIRQPSQKGTSQLEAT